MSWAFHRGFIMIFTNDGNKRARVEIYIRKRHRNDRGRFAVSNSLQKFEVFAGSDHVIDEGEIEIGVGDQFVIKSNKKVTVSF